MREIAEGLEAHISNIDQQQGSWSKFRQIAGRIGLAVGITLGGGLGAVATETMQAEQHIAEAEAEPQGANNFDNALVASFGVTENGKKFATGWGQPGECMVAAQRWANKANNGKNIWNHRRNGVLSIYQDSGGVEVGLDRLKPGDILQRSSAGSDADTNWSHVHTVVFRGYGANKSMNIVDANRYLDGTVRVSDNYTLTAPTGWRWHAFRMGKVSNTPSQPSYSRSLTKPAALTRSEGNMDVFYRDSLGNLINEGWDVNRGWASPAAVARGISSNPTAVSRNDGSMDIFYRDTNNNLQNVGWNWKTGWSGAYPRVADGTLAGDPTVISRTPESMDVFYKNYAGNLINIGWTALRGWNSPQTLIGDGSVAGNPVAVTRTEGNMDVFYRDKHGNLVNKGWDVNQGWMGSSVRATGASDDPAVVSRTPASMDVFYQTARGGLGNAAWNSTSGWSAKDLVTSGVITSPTVVARTDGNMDVFYENSSRQLYNIGWDYRKGWSGPYSRASDEDGAPVGITRGSGNMDIFFRAGDGRLKDAGWDVNAGWRVSNPGNATDMVR